MHAFNGGDKPKDQTTRPMTSSSTTACAGTRSSTSGAIKSGKATVANSKLNYFEQIAERLRDKGWRAIIKKTGDVEHLEHHRFIGKMHKGDDPRLHCIRHNTNNGADLCASPWESSPQ